MIPVGSCPAPKLTELSKAESKLTVGAADKGEQRELTASKEQRGKEAAQQGEQTKQSKASIPLSDDDRSNAC